MIHFTRGTNRSTDDGRAAGVATAAALAEIFGVSKSILLNLNAAMRHTGLTFPRYEVMAFVAAGPNGCATTGDLYRGLRRHPTTTGTLLDGLVDTGMLTRSVNPDDRREVVVTITERGESALAAASRAMGNAFTVDSEVLTSALSQLRAVDAAGRPATGSTS